MVFIKTIFCVTVLMFQTEALPANFEENSTIENVKDHILNFLIEGINEETIETLTGHHIESHGSLESFLFNVKRTLNKIDTCTPETHLKLFKLATLKWGDFQACINATKDIASFELFLYDFYNYAITVDHNLVNVSKALISCHKEPNVFDILNCIVSSIQNSGPEFDEILTDAKALIAEVESDTESLFYYVKKCLGFSKTELALEVYNLLKTSC